MTPVKIEDHMSNLYDAAMEMLDHGWSFVPTSLTTKRPVMEWKEFQTRQPTVDEVESWFTDGVKTEYSIVRHFNLAVITGEISNLVVVDADSADAISACDQAGLSTPFSVTTRRGRHYYFSHPGTNTKNAVNVAGIQGVDLRGDGGYVVAPPGVRMDDNTGQYIQYYTWDRALDWDDLPVWQGHQGEEELGSVDFRFDALDLSQVGTQTVKATIWDIIRLDVAANGKYGGSGRAGRNNALTRFLGELLHDMTPFEEIPELVHKFQEEFFNEPLDESEIQTTWRSLLERDRKARPQNYDEEGRPKQVKKEEPQGRKLIFADDVDAIRKKIGDTDFLIDPWLAPATIVQVFGYNGHGKSMFVSQCLWHLAQGNDFGPYTMHKKARILYCDWENPPLTIADRMEMFTKSFGHPGENFAFWSPALLGDDMNLKEEQGRIALLEYVEMYKPDVLVIDTVRSAFPGLEENNAADWSPVNRLAKAFRNMGIAVVLLHHSTKPNQDGLMGESGSSSQLTDLDQQIQVMQLFDDKKRAAAKRGAYAPVIWDDLREMTPVDFSIKYVFEARYRKIRQETDNHVTAYIGCALNDNEDQIIRSNRSPMQFARMKDNAGQSVEQIQAFLRDIGSTYLNEVSSRHYSKEELQDNGGYLMYAGSFVPKKSIARMIKKEPLSS